MPKKIQRAGFWIRLIADFIDSVFLDLATCLIFIVGIGALFWMSRFGGVAFLDAAGKGGAAESTSASFLSSFGTLKAQLFLVGIRIILSLIYYTLATYRWGTTLGKMPLGIQVVSAEGRGDGRPVTFRQALLRCLGYGLSYSVCGAGFLMVAFHPEKRALHEILSGTQSIQSTRALLRGKKSSKKTQSS